MIRRYRSLILLTSLAVPGLAYAHTPIKTLNSFYNGMLHPVFVPAQVLLLVATGLFLGQQGVKENLGAVGVFLVATISGLVAAWFSTGIDLEIFILSMAAMVGLLIAANPVFGPYFCIVIGAVSGFVLGMDSSQETLTGKIKFLSLFGSGVGIYLLMLYPMGVVNFFNTKNWQKIGVRIIGSWVAASALLVLALSIAYKP
jgi:hydrogenase/urease accessory protein HupE